MPLSSNPDWNLTQCWPGRVVVSMMLSHGRPAGTWAHHLPDTRVWKLHKNGILLFRCWCSMKHQCTETSQVSRLARPATDAQPHAPLPRLISSSSRQNWFGRYSATEITGAKIHSGYANGVPWHWHCKCSHVIESSGPFFFPPTIVYCDPFLISHSSFNFALSATSAKHLSLFYHIRAVEIDHVSDRKKKCKGIV